MPDDDTNANFHSFDREPSTGPGQLTNTTKSADMDHRIESGSIESAVDTAPVHTPGAGADPVAAEPVRQTTPTELGVAAPLPNPGPGLMVLQWLVYALWGWTVFALSGLVVLVVNQIISKNSDDSGLFDWGGEGISYLLAAVLVLFVIALICDIFYATAERKHARTTGTNVIMIIHAVLFALFGIGALISAVFGGVQLMIGDTTDVSNAVASIISSVVIFGLYGVTLLRTLRPRWLKNVAAVYWIIISVVVIVSVALAIVGPAAEARLGNEDKILEQSLPGLADIINRQTERNGSLPANLNEVTGTGVAGTSDDIKSLIDSGKVEYKPGEKLPVAARPVDPALTQQGGTDPVIYHYQLCVVYKTSQGRDSYDSNYIPKGQRYDTSISTYSHPAGKICYDVQTDYMSNY